MAIQYGLVSVQSSTNKNVRLCKLSDHQRSILEELLRQNLNIGEPVERMLDHSLPMRSIEGTQYSNVPLYCAKVVKLFRED